MNKDIRISVGLPRHPKMIKLIRKVGEGAFRCLITLWCFAAENRSNGDLYGMDEMDIAIASGWDDGSEDKWLDALISCGFIDRSAAGLRLHDWEDNNPWAAGAEQRSEKAKNAAAARYAKRNAANSTATSTNEHNNEHDLAELKDELSYAPSPSPSPSPSPDSEASASGAIAPAIAEIDREPDLKAIIFGQGLAWLSEKSGKTPDKLRSALGRACRDYGDGRVIEVLSAAQREGPIDPLAWMERAFQARGSPAPSKHSITAAAERLRQELSGAEP